MTEWISSLGREFVGVQSRADVYHATVTACIEALDADMCMFTVADDGVLSPAASIPEGHPWNRSEFDISASLPGCVYSRGEPCVVEDITDVRSAASASSAVAPRTGGSCSGGYQSMVLAPVAGVGVLVAASETPAAFADSDQTALDCIASYAAAALDEVESMDDVDQLDEIASILSHDLKSPLSVARGRLEMVGGSGDAEHLSEALLALDRIEAIIEDIVALARSNERIGSVTPVTLNRLVLNAWSTVAAPSASLEIVDSTEILAAESATCQLLENLFWNAIDHAGPDVSVRVGMLDEGGFFVEDNGPGIPVDVRDEVFEWGQSRADGHGGLGLAIADRIADAHDWEITITDSEHGGARFEITNVELPLPESACRH